MTTYHLHHLSVATDYGQIKVAGDITLGVPSQVRIQN
jgi:hypothetical protein